MRKSIYILLILISTVASQAIAESGNYCFEEAGEKYKISPELLRSISRVESDHNVRAINYNYNDKGHMVNYDYCHMQINSSWEPMIGRDNWMKLGDPCQCTMTGASILADCIQRYGNTWEAVGCYHAKSRGKRREYAWKIFQVLNKQNTCDPGNNVVLSNGNAKNYCSRNMATSEASTQDVYVTRVSQ